MRFAKHFLRDERGNTFQSISLMAGAIAIAAIAGTHFLDRATQDGALAGLPFAGTTDGARYSRAMANLPRGQNSAPQTNQQVTVDYTPTGSIPANLAGPVILDPCTGVRK
jgi:Flp pilus assembly pilin Flp